MTESVLSLIPNNYLKFGIFLAPFQGMKENPTQAMHRDMLLLEHLDDLGYHEAWIGEHHSGGMEILACPELFIAAAAERTRHIRLGTGVVSLPYPAEQRRMMNESLDAIVRLLDGELVNMKTDWFHLQDARLQIPSFQVPRVEMAVACARSPSGALAAGKHGIGMLSIGGTSDDALAAHANNWRMCEEAAADNGQSVDREKWRLVTLMHVAETREKARENVLFGLDEWAQYFREIATFPIVPADIEDAYEYLLENKMACIGTPDDAITYIETLLQGAGGFGALMQLAHNWADWEDTKRSYELISRYVFPYFQNSNWLRDYSYEYSFKNRDAFVGEAAQAIQTEIDRYQARNKGEAAE